MIPNDSRRAWVSVVFATATLATVGLRGSVRAQQPPPPPPTGVVFGKINVNSTTKLEVPGGGDRTGQGSYSLHASAFVQGAPDPNPQVKHKPVDQPKEIPKDFEPVRIIKVDGKDRAIYNVPTKNYLSDPKPFGQGLVATDEAKREATVKGTTTTAKGQAAAKFVETKVDTDKFYTVDTTGSVADVKQIGFGAPDGRATSLVLDPLTFSDAEPGDILRGFYSLTADDFQVQVNDPGGVFASFAEGGTNLLGPPTDPLMTDFAGNELIFRLLVTVLPDSTVPDVLFTFNSAFNFYNPGVDPDQTGPAIPSSLVKSTFEDRFRSALVPGAGPGGIFRLKDDITLFSFNQESPSSLGTDGVSVDFASGQVAVVAVPEPTIGVLMASSLTTVAAYLLASHARRRDRVVG
jgi:hypothetical protein